MLFTRVAQEVFLHFGFIDGRFRRWLASRCKARAVSFSSVLSSVSFVLWRFLGRQLLFAAHHPHLEDANASTVSLLPSCVAGIVRPGLTA